VDDARVRGKRLQLARHAVVKAHAQRNHEVGLVRVCVCVCARARVCVCGVWEVFGRWGVARRRSLVEHRRCGCAAGGVCKALS
jgi:hypothetical protein